MIACIGESLIDTLGERHLVGGCPFNVAKAAARLGASVAYFGKVSKDPYGLQILESMINDCVIFDPMLCNSDYPTLCSKAVIDENGNARYVFDYQGTSACEITKQELSDAFSVMTDIDMAFFGSISLLMKPGCDAIVPAIHGIKSRPKMFLDPNVRPSMVSDPDAYRQMILALLGECDIVKASEEDISYLLPGFEMQVAEDRFAGLCEWNLVVTRGERGCTWYTKDFRVDCPAYPVSNVVDTIGCGDTFDGAIMTYLQKHDLVNEIHELDQKTISDILAYAAKASALNCTKEGCNPPFAEEL